MTLLHITKLGNYISLSFLFWGFHLDLNHHEKHGKQSDSSSLGHAGVGWLSLPATNGGFGRDRCEAHAIEREQCCRNRRKSAIQNPA